MLSTLGKKNVTTVKTSTTKWKQQEMVLRPEDGRSMMTCTNTKNSNDEKINNKAAGKGSKTCRWKVSDDLLITVQFSTGSGLTATIIVVM